MSVYLVGVGDCESYGVICACATKELAVKKLFEQRDKMVLDWIKYRDHKDSFPSSVEMYQKMIDSLAGKDYENWNNYPHETPTISEQEVLTS